MNQSKMICQSIIDGERLSEENALWLWQNGELSAMREAAQIVRDRMTTPGSVSYTGFRVVNYTSVCEIDCTFCSFKEDSGYVLSLEQVKEKAIEAQKNGVDQIFFQGGVNRSLDLDYYTEILSMLSGELGMNVRAFSPVELYYILRKTGKSIGELLFILKENGLKSVPGAGAEILTLEMRKKLSPKKLSAEKWCEIMGECHKQGLPGSANIVFGSSETDDDIIEHLSYIRTQQDKTGGFKAFIPWVFQQRTDRFEIKDISTESYLKMVSLCRLFLDNIPNIEVSLMVMGLETGMKALHAGANDISSFVMEENVLESHAPRTREEAERFIINAGFNPVYRNFDYLVPTKAGI